MIFREITDKDMVGIFNVRVNTDENRFTYEELKSLGITEENVIKMIITTHKGWLCEIDGKIVSFAMGDKTSGELWVIATLPEYTGRGIGSKLLKLVEDWLAEMGWKKFWLTTNLDMKLKAYSFYLKNGWKDDKTNDRLRFMIKEI